MKVWYGDNYCDENFVCVLCIEQLWWWWWWWCGDDDDDDDDDDEKFYISIWLCVVYRAIVRPLVTSVLRHLPTSNINLHYNSGNHGDDDEDGKDDKVGVRAVLSR